MNQFGILPSSDMDRQGMLGEILDTLKLFKIALLGKRRTCGFSLIQKQQKAVKKWGRIGAVRLPQDTPAKIVLSEARRPVKKKIPEEDRLRHR